MRIETPKHRNFICTFLLFLALVLLNPSCVAPPNSQRLPIVFVDFMTPTAPALTPLPTSDTQSRTLMVKYRIDCVTNKNGNITASLVLIPMNGTAPYKIPGFEFVESQIFSNLNLGDVLEVTIISSDQPPLKWTGEIIIECGGAGGSSNNNMIPTIAPTFTTESLTPPETKITTRVSITPTEQPANLESTYPIELTVGQTELVTLQLLGKGTDPDAPIIVISSGAPITQNPSPKRTSVREAGMRVFPIMSAELVAANFNVVNGDENSNRVFNNSTSSAVWTWSIESEVPGKHVITINIFGVDELSSDTPPTLVKSISTDIIVQERPFLERARVSLANNWLALLGTTGPIGLFIAYLAYRKQAKELEESRKRAKDLEERISMLEQRTKDKPKRTKK